MEFTTSIDSIKKDIYDVKKFKARKPTEFKFQCGQYFLLSIVNDKDNISKPFTFTSSPTEEIIEFAIKKIGKFTEKVHSLKEGDEIKIKGPFGQSIIFNKDIKSDIVLLAGGSGIAPFISTIRYIIAKGLKNKVTLLCANRTKKDIMFKEELKEIAEKNDNIKIVNTLTREEWDSETGYFSKEMIDKYVTDKSERIWYICGTPKLVDATKTVLNSIGIDEDNIKSEQWLMVGKK